MKAVVQDRYGSADELQVREVEKPKVEQDDVLVRVKAVSLNPADWHIMRAQPHLVRAMAGFRRPTPIRGLDVAGVVEAVGSEVSEFEPGDEVFGHLGRSLAEYVSGKEDRFTAKPERLSFEQAASLGVAGLTALQGLRDHGRVQAGQKVLITGASGGVGSFAVQIAKALGAHVTGVCGTTNVELVRSLGADRVIDYTRENALRRGDRYDVIFYAAGTDSLGACKRCLTEEGTYVGVGSSKHGNWIGPLIGLVLPSVMSRFSSRKFVTFIAKHRKEDLLFLKQLVDEGKLTPVVARTYPLEEAPEAMRFLEAQHPGGKVVVTV